MSKKEQLETMIYYYDHRDKSNKYVTEDAREYVFSNLVTRDEWIKEFKKNIYNPVQKQYYKGITASALFLCEMQKFRGQLSELLKPENRKWTFDFLRKNLMKMPHLPLHPDFRLDYSSFEWACMTVPRAWLK